MDPMGQGFRFDFAVDILFVMLVGACKLEKKKMWEFLSIMGLHLGNPSVSSGYKRFVGDQQSFSDFC